MVIDVPSLSSILFNKFKGSAKELYKIVNVVLEPQMNTETDNCKLTQNRKKNYRLCRYGTGKFDEEVCQFANEVIKTEGEFWVAYAENIGTSYDIKTLILASK